MEGGEIFVFASNLAGRHGRDSAKEARINHGGWGGNRPTQHFVVGDRREYPSTPEEAFEASVEGAYYSQQMAKVELEGRVGAFDTEPGYPVHTAWDIGIGDDTAIWCFQVLPGRVRLVGYYTNSGVGLVHYLDVLERLAFESLWSYGAHYMPHDIQAREWTAGRTRIEMMLSEGRKRHLGCGVRMVPLHRIEDGINAPRQLLGLCEFDAGPCAESRRSRTIARNGTTSVASGEIDRAMTPPHTVLTPSVCSR